MFDEANVDIKEQVAEARRTQILQGAAHVFADKGYHKATTKQIARAAGVSEGTIYNYFSTKRDLLVAMMQAIAARTFENVVLDHATDNPRDFMLAIFRERLQLLERYGYVLAPIIAEIFADVELRQAVYSQIARPISAYLEQYIQARIDAGEFRPVDPVVITRAIVGATFLNLTLKLSGLDSRYDHLSYDALLEELVDFYLASLLASRD